MIELFIIGLMMMGFGAFVALYAAVMVFYFKVIKRSPKSISQIMSEV